MEFNKNFVKKYILEALQKLLPWNKIILRNQAITLSNQSVYSWPVYFKKFILRKGVAKQLDDVKVVSSAQAIPLILVILIVIHFLISPMLIYSILILLLIAII